MEEFQKCKEQILNSYSINKEYMDKAISNIKNKNTSKDCPQRILEGAHPNGLADDQDKDKILEKYISDNTINYDYAILPPYSDKHILLLIKGLIIESAKIERELYSREKKLPKFAEIISKLSLLEKAPDQENIYALHKGMLKKYHLFYEWTKIDLCSRL